MLIQDVTVAAKEKIFLYFERFGKYYSHFKGNNICTRRSFELAQAKYKYFCSFNG